MANVHNVNIDRIKSLAKAQGLTMKYLCDCIGKHRGFLSCVRNGTDRIDEDELAVIAGKINSTVAYLTGQTDDPEPVANPTAPLDDGVSLSLSEDETELLELYKRLEKSGKRQLLGKAYELLDAQNAPRTGDELTPPNVDMVTTVLNSRIKTKVSNLDTEIGEHHDHHIVHGVRP